MTKQVSSGTMKRRKLKADLRVQMLAAHIAANGPLPYFYNGKGSSYVDAHYFHVDLNGARLPVSIRVGRVYVLRAGAPFMRRDNLTAHNEALRRTSKWVQAVRATEHVVSNRERYVLTPKDCELLLAAVAGAERLRKDTSPMSTNESSASILGRAMLMRVDVSFWGARKTDKKVTRQVAEENRADYEAGNFHKYLFGKRNEKHDRLYRAYRAVRKTFWAHTLPWDDDNWRLLPTAAYDVAMKDIRTCISELENARDAFVAALPELKETARVYLGDMFNEDEYPSAASVREKFSVRVRVTPIPAAGDFRVSLPDEEMERVKQDLEADVADQLSNAMQDTWSRLGEVVTMLSSKLDDGKRIRKDIGSRIKEVAESLGRLNVTGNPELEEARKQAITLADGIDVDALKTNEKERTDAKAITDKILAAVGAFGGN